MLAGSLGQDTKNVIFVIFDDLNDWLSVYGHAEVHTPNFDRLARYGLTFESAYCAAPVCNASRASTFLGRHVVDTGIQGNNTPIREFCEDLTIFELFKLMGFETAGFGKIFHDQSGETWQAYVRGQESPLPPRFGKRPSMWTTFHHTRPVEGGITPPGRGVAAFGSALDGESPAREAGLSGREDYTGGDIYGIQKATASPYATFDWGSPEISEALYPDRANVEAFKASLNEARAPFCHAVGIHQPHLPWYAPKRFFDLYKTQHIRLPEVRNDPLSNAATWARRKVVNSKYHEWIADSGKWIEAVEAYLASVSFADEMLGEILDALEQHPERDETLFVVTTDHGWHLGEMQHWGKSTLWERATKVPLLIAGPGVRPGRSSHVVSLIDLVPTLAEMFSLPQRPHWSGRSLTALLRDGESAEEGRALSTLRGQSHTLRVQDWRYICYRNGDEELYDHRHDSSESKNVADDPAYAAVLRGAREKLEEEIKRQAGVAYD